MAKKNMGKVIQMLSPENYIRTKSRSLPIFECLINTDWDEAKMASIIIARQHTGGNISFCFYAVDLTCLGVKYSTFMFNITMVDYKATLKEFDSDVTLTPVDYALVHNIIHAGVEFAEEYEFKPCKDFTSVTQYFLEEDTDDIELIDIECGDDYGQPCYVYDKSMVSDKEVKRITAQLERTAGPENYSVTEQDDLIDEVEDDSYDMEDDYSLNSFDKNKEIFINLHSILKDSENFRELTNLAKVTDTLFEEMTDNELVDQYFYELIESLSIDVETKTVSNELLGISPDVQKDNDLIDLFMSVYYNIHSNMKKARVNLKRLKEVAGELPVIAFLEIVILRKEKSDKYAETLEIYARQYPDYAMITLLRLIEVYSSGDVPDEIKNKTFNLNTLFPGRNSIGFLEMFYYLLFLSAQIAYQGNAERMEAFYKVLCKRDLQNDLSETVEEIFSVSRIEYLVKYFNIKDIYNLNKSI